MPFPPTMVVTWRPLSINFAELIEGKTEASKKFIENEVPNIPEGQAKLNVFKAELALLKLRGATPKELASDFLDISERFMGEYKSVDFAKEFSPGIALRRLIEGDKEFSDLLNEHHGGVDKFIELATGVN